MMQRSFFSSPQTHCRQCGRPLSNPLSVQRSMAPVCSSKHGTTEANAVEPDFADFTLFDPATDGIVLRRDGVGVCTNIPHIVTHHSPTGFEFGYAGSGPADLALNICELMLNRSGHTGERMKCFDGDCWTLAFELHQKFKFEFIANSPREGCVIPYVKVQEWLRAANAEAKP